MARCRLPPSIGRADLTGQQEWVVELLINGKYSHRGAEQLARRERRQVSAMKIGEKGPKLTGCEEPQGPVTMLLFVEKRLKCFRRDGCRFFDVLKVCWTGDVRIPIYFARKAESDIYLAFRTVASTWASKLQGKFTDSGSKKRASNTIIPLSSSLPLNFLTSPWHNNRKRKLGQSSRPWNFRLVSHSKNLKM